MQKTTRLNRLLAAIVAVFMVVCCLPLNAFAEETSKSVKVLVTFHDTVNDVDVEMDREETLTVTPDKDGDYFFLWKDFYATVKATEGYEYTNKKADDEPFYADEDDGFVVDVKPVEKEPVWLEANYKVNFVDENGTPIKDAVNVSPSWLDGQAPTLLDTLQTTLQTVVDMGYTFNKVCFYNYDEPVSDTTVVVEGNHELTAYFTKNVEEPEWLEATYKVNFVDENGTPIKDAVNVSPSWLDGQAPALLDTLQTTLQTVVDMGYTLNKVCFFNYDEAISDTTVVVEGNYELTAYFTKNVEPSQDREAVYTVNFVDENGNKIKEPVNVNMSWVDGQELYVLAQLDSTLKSVEGYTFQNLTAYNGTEPYDGDELVVEGNYTLTAHYTKIDLDRDTTYKINFVDQNNNIIRDPAVVTIGWVDGQDLYVLAQLESTLNGVEGNYSFDKLTAWNGTEAITDTVKVVPGSYELTAHYILGGKDCNSKYTIHFVDENNNEFMDPAVVDMAWVEGQELNLMTQLKSTLDSVSAKGYTFKTLTAWNGTEAYKGDELVVPGEYELIAHCVKNTSGSTGDDSSDNKTVSSSNNNQVVKAEAPADNTAKVMPQTGLNVETPVVFGVMMVAALAGAGAYLFAIRKKLN